MRASEGGRGVLAARATLQAEAEARKRVRLAERWIALPREPRLYLHAVTAEGVWYKHTFADSGRETHGLAPWADVMREISTGGPAHV